MPSVGGVAVVKEGAAAGAANSLPSRRWTGLRLACSMPRLVPGARAAVDSIVDGTNALFPADIGTSLMVPNAKLDDITACCCCSVGFGWGPIT